MVSSFHPHSMCEKVERVTTKTGCTSCTKRTISFELHGFIWKLVCFKGISFFWTYLNSIVFLCSKYTIQSHIINLQPFLTYLLFFMHLLIILSYKTLKLKSISNELWKGWKLAWYHHFTHIACAINWEGYGKNWMHFLYKTDNLFRSIRVSYGNSSVTKGFQFSWTYWNPLVFIFSKCTIQSHIINF